MTTVLLQDVRLCVCDDGVGLRAEAFDHPGHDGLWGMRELVKGIGGILSAIAPGQHLWVTAVERCCRLSRINAEVWYDTVVDISVLIVEDHILMRWGLRTILEPGMRVVGEVKDGAEGVRKTLSFRLTIILMDGQMLVMNSAVPPARSAALLC